MIHRQQTPASSPRILFLTHVGNPGGAEICGIALCKSLGNQAHFTHFQEGALSDIFAAEGISSSVLPMPSEITGIKREDGIKGILAAIPRFFPFVLSLIRHSKRYDAIICMSQKSFIFSALAKPFARRPIIWFMNDLLSKEHFNPLMIKALTRVFQHAANQIILNSQASYEAWLHSGGRKENVHIIYPGTNVDAIAQYVFSRQEQISALKTQLSPDGKPLIGIFGRICTWKGQDVFINALAALPKVQGIIVGGAQFGEADYLAQLRQLAQAKGVSERVQFLGHQDNVWDYMAACDVVAHCSTSPEPFGLVIAEAMSCGVPVVISDAGGAKEIIMSHPLNAATTPADAGQLAQKIQDMLSSDSDKAAYAEAARAHIRAYFSTKSMCSHFKERLTAQLPHILLSSHST